MVGDDACCGDPKTELSVLIEENDVEDGVEQDADASKSINRLELKFGTPHWQQVHVMSVPSNAL